MAGELIVDALRNAILITGLVVVMMMLIESLNIESGGAFFSGLRRSRLWQVVISAMLGSVPGCMGGFASVSLYTHGMLSFGALVAMMIASSGDEAFVMLAMMPKDAVWIMVLLLAVAIAVGWLTDLLYHPKRPIVTHCEEGFTLHDGDTETGEEKHRHLSGQRIAMFVGVIVFLFALLTGQLEHEHDHHKAEAVATGINLLSETWMNWLFGGLSLIVLGVLLFGNDHFVEEHLWHHIVLKHLPRVFAWSFGVLLALGFALHYLDMASWMGNNTALLILIATLVGIIPESGPHLIFVTLYASGMVPLPVLLASCISQDGHAGLPLLAESRKSFLLAKLINCIAALAVGYGALLFC